MASKNKKRISLCDNTFIDFNMPDNIENIHTMCILGNTDGLFGKFIVTDKCVDIDVYAMHISTYMHRLLKFKQILENNTKLTIFGDNKTCLYWKNVLLHFNPDASKYIGQILFVEINTNEEYLSKLNDCNMKFDYIIQNPPYTTPSNTTIYINFIDKMFDMLSDNGQMVSITPSMWLTNLRPSPEVRKYDMIKQKVAKNVEYVVFEQYSDIFNIGQEIPLSVTHFNKAKYNANIHVKNCGIEFTTDNIYDCNFIGNYDTFHSILKKCMKFHTLLKDRITKVSVHGMCYIERSTKLHTDDGYFYLLNVVNTNIGQFHNIHISPCIHKNRQDILNEIVDNPNARYKKYVYGTKEELENYKHYVLTNKLPIFLNIAMFINQDEYSKYVVPFIVDKQYTDEEIYKLLDISEEEAKFIDYVINKFKYESAYFKRFMTGDTTIELNQEEPWKLKS